MRHSRDVLAVPLTPGEAQLLVSALYENDRLQRIHFWTHDGCGWSRSAAEAVLKRAGTAAALGHPLVPALVQDLHMYDDVVLHGLQQYAPDSQIASDFAQLLRKMHALSGMAQVHRWRAEPGAGGWQWHETPPGQSAPQEPAPALARGKRGRR
jgi:hypothetical protein